MVNVMAYISLDLDNGNQDNIFFLFSPKTYTMGIHKNHLCEVFLMGTQYIYFAKKKMIKHYENMPVQICRKFHLQKLKSFR